MTQPNTPPKDAPAAAQPAIVQTATLEQLTAMMAGLTQAVTLLVERGVKDQPPELAAAIAGLKAATEMQGRLTEEVNRTQRKSNATHPGLSVFTYDPRCEFCVNKKPHPDTNELAHPKPVLKYDTSFCFGRQDAEQLTPLEVELYNSFTESREARDGTWTATLTKHGKRQHLHVKVPCVTIDDLAVLPPLTAILTELLYGQIIADPMASNARIAALEQMVAELRQNQLAKPSGGPVPATS